MTDSKVAIITGSADGLGKAIALRLAADGCDVVVNDLPHQSERLQVVVQEIETVGRRATSFIGDVSVDEDVQNLIEHAVSTFGGLDIVCILKSSLHAL
jgi:NAD(P)-dependent dehydrogenase (short-subunit alcohol dehydrogenase family)